MFRNTIFSILVGIIIVNCVFGEEDEKPEITDKVPYMVRVESCSGWRLNKLPEVKNFIKGDLETKFLNSEFVKIPGKDPELIFYNKNDEELERIEIKDWLRSELVELLDNKGIERQPFHPKPSPNEVDDELKEKVIDALKEHEDKEAKNEL